MNSGSGFFRILTTVVVFLALEIISIVLISHNSVIQRYKFMGVIRNSQTALWQKAENFRYYFNYKNENERLVTENEMLRDIISKYESIDFYRDSLVESISPYYTYVPATIIKKTTNKQHNYIVINKGSDNGISEGMGVVTSKGVIGVIASVSAHYSYVISFLNTSQSVSVKVLGKDVYGPMSWDGGSIDGATLRDIPIHKEIAIGDSIATSGYSNLYPTDIPVGVISSFKNNNGLAYDVDVELFEDYNAIRFVNVVVNNDLNELSELEGRYE